MSEPRVVAVVVAFNRRDLLIESLLALRGQSRAPDRVLVVDNASEDGTSEVVAERFPEVELIRLTRNTGGAGGFAVGIHHAVSRLAADLVWIMDDDTVPGVDALAELLRARAHAPAGTEIVGSRVVWIDGRDHPMNTPRVNPFASRRAVSEARAHGCYPVRSASFVSLLVDAGAVRRVGLPVVDYFLWNDDFEYTMRILRRARGYIATRSVVVHKTKVFGSTDIDPGPRFRFEVRNKAWMILRSSALSPGERLVYSVASLRRWVATFANSTDRAVLRRGLIDGLREAFAGRPRPNAVALARSGANTTAIEMFERDVASGRWT